MEHADWYTCTVCYEDVRKFIFSLKKWAKIRHCLTGNFEGFFFYFLFHNPKVRAFSLNTDVDRGFNSQIYHFYCLCLHAAISARCMRQTCTVYIRSYNTQESIHVALKSVFLINHVIFLYVSVFSAQLLVLSGVKISNLVPVHKSSGNAVLDK